jgi:nucleoside-diphosphate-sugar epimerase
MNILISGAGGFIGQALAAALLSDSSVQTMILTDVFEPPVPISHNSQHPFTAKVRCFKADLTDRSTCETLFNPSLTLVYLLHGLMSGAAEANLDLGLRVNVDSTRQILDILRTVAPGVRVIFPSSLAVFGPMGDQVVTESTIALPQSSYGAEKLICEILLNDFSRRGLLDGRILRLPTIVVRPGVPSGAASSFCSGIIREPLKGQKSQLPVSTDMKLWICSTRTIIKNLVLAKDVPAEKFSGLSRVVILPGVTVTVEEMLAALQDVGGEQATKLVVEKRDPAVEKIVGNWPAVFDTSMSKKLGFLEDGPLSRTVREYIEDYGQ